MGCGDAARCTREAVLDWELPDPAGKTLAEVRPIRDEIALRIGRLISELLHEPDEGGEN